jgi:hypothetical protein
MLPMPFRRWDNSMSDQLLDSFEDLSGWTAIASGQAWSAISSSQGRVGSALRMEFDFHGGGGFVVARRPFVARLPESCVFSFAICGHGPDNIFEFKLIDASNQNVWRWRVEAFALAADWQSVHIKSSDIQFAWGPLGGGPPRDIAAMELVVAAGPGGKGEIQITDLRLADTSYYLTPLVDASSCQPGHEPQHLIDPSPQNSWRSTASGEPQQVLIDFQREREYGGLTIQWEPSRRPRTVKLWLSCDDSEWRECFSTEHGVGKETHVYLPRAVSRFIRLEMRGSLPGDEIGITCLEVQPHAFSRSINDFFTAIAGRARAGMFPKYLLNRQTYWTPVGTGDDITQALFNEEGMVEVDRGSFSIEPMLFADGQLITWADATLTQTLEDGYLPIPSSQWRTGDFTLRTTAFATAVGTTSTLYIRYCVTNDSTAERRVRLFAAIRPFQVTPTWQNWRDFGGVSGISEISWESGSILVDRNKRIIPLLTPSQFGAATFAQGAVTEYLLVGELPAHENVLDPFGYASAALRFDLTLAAQATEEVFLAIPFGSADAGLSGALETATSGAQHFGNAVDQWQDALGAFDIALPPVAAGVVETMKTAAAHILINRAGPALHPGPRRYSRSWIRDGVLMGAALARVGLPAAGRDFIHWFAAFQTSDGNLPDCADNEGCEWLPEYDCWGQLIFAVMDHYRFSGDKEFLAAMWPAVRKSVDYMESLRRQRMTQEYQAPAKRACYGLLPESMSHEGYMAHPVHAYWDDFWAALGFGEAADMAALLGLNEERDRLANLREDFQRTLRDSLRQVIDEHRLDFVPGSVEFADFDPSATSIAITVADLLQHLPRPAIEQTYDKYLQGFRTRVDGSVPWANYSAYEIRNIGALVRLGRREDAYALLRFFLADRRLRDWNQWPEISWHDPLSPSFIGDMPHSWIGAEYILAIHSLFAYERRADHSLVIAAGIPAAWLEDGNEIVVRDLPTCHGRLSYRVRQDGNDVWRVTLQGAFAMPVGGIVIMPPLAGPLIEVQIDDRDSTTFATDWALCTQCPAEVVLRSASTASA